MRGRTILMAVITVAAIWFGSARADPPDKMMPGPPPGDRMFIGGPGGPHGMMMGEGAGFMLPLVLHRANLTPEQHEKVRKILESDRQDLQKLFSALGKANDGQGHVGDPTKATAAIGKLILEAQISDGANQIKKLRMSSRQ